MVVPPRQDTAAMPAPSTLRAIMDRLRAGCPWDRAQTHGSLAPCLREEAAEALDAVAGLREGDAASEGHLCEELGDLWLQVAFHALLAEERGAFDIHDVEAAAVGKLLGRHPHVFGGAPAEGADAALASWQAAKRRERPPALLDGAKADLSSLGEAAEIGRLCAGAGFDWDGVDGVLGKVKEEIEELSAESGRQRVEEELGDVLFSLVQWARHKGIDPDMALRRQMARFRGRFRAVEARAAQAGGWARADRALLEDAWQRAKEGE